MISVWTATICVICLNSGRPEQDPAETIISALYVTPSRQTDDATRTAAGLWIFWMSTLWTLSGKDDTETVVTFSISTEDLKNELESKW